FYFFFQAEDGIRDRNVRSSDVCSSDLPDIDAEDRMLAVHHRIVLVRGALDRQLATVVDQPDPAAAEAADAALVHLFLEGVEAPEIGRASCREREDLWGGGRAVREDSGR